MKEFGIAAMTLTVTALITLAGISGKKILLIDGPKTAVIILGIIGMAFCTLSVGRFIAANPAHPLTIAGYLVGMIALLTLLTQIFKWNLPIIYKSQTALFVLAGSILIKTIIGRLITFIH